MSAWGDKDHVEVAQQAEDAENGVDDQDRHAYGLFQALPLTGSDPDGPTDAEMYLQQVRHEASRLPFVVSSSSKGVYDSPAEEAPPTTQPPPSTTPVTTNPALLPNPTWITTFLAQFDALRASIIQNAEPNTPTSVGALLQNTRVDGTDTPPTTDLLQGLDHLGTIRLLKQRIHQVVSQSAEDAMLSSLDAQWLFGLLARLELPIDSDTAALLSSLQRHLVELRRRVHGVDDPILAPINVLLVAIGARFGQDETLAPLYGN